MKGFNVLFPMAFHITGTPIGAISARIARGDQETLNLYRTYVSLYVDDRDEVERIISSFEKPEKVAEYFSNVIANDFNSLGCSIDWRRRFTTGDPEYNAFVSWQFIQFMEKGYITQGTYPILFCPADGQAVGEDDIESGDEIAAAVEEYVAMKFTTNDGRALLAATLRPETIFGATNVWVRPDSSYVELRVGDERWVISEEAEEKLRLQGWEYEVVKRLNGGELVGLAVKTPTGAELPVLPASFVDPDSATGIVYSVPAHAPFDYAALVELKGDPGKFGVATELVTGVEPIHIIDVPGYGEWPAKEAVEKRDVRSQGEGEALEEATKEIYKAEFYGGVLVSGPFSGRRIAEVKGEVLNWLGERGAWTPFYEVTAKEKPVRCRCGADIRVAVLRDQWFLNYNAPGWKEGARKALARMEISPRAYRKLFEDTTEWLDKRPCARRRGLGTKLPFDDRWIIESLSDSTIYMAFYTVMLKIRELRIPSARLTPEFWDHVFLGKGDRKSVAAGVRIPEEDLEQMRAEFLYWYPMDQRHTAIGHITNHLLFSIFHHVAIFPEELWPKRFTLNELLIREGKKMSKSRGNVISLVDVPRKYSADWFRLYMASAADLSTTLDWREANVRTVGSALRRFFDLAMEIASSGTGGNSGEGELSLLDEWISSKVNSAVKEVERSFSSYRHRDAAIRGFFTLLRDVEAYLEYGTGNFSLLRELLRKWILIIAPITPHIAEEVWSALGGHGFASHASWPEAEGGKIRGEVELGYEVVQATIEDAKNILKVLKGEKPKKLRIFLAPSWKYEAIEALKELRPPIELKDAIGVLVDSLKEHGEEAKALAREFSKAQGVWKSTEKAVEVQMFECLARMISNKVGVEVLIEEASRTDQPRASRAMPGKPALLF